MKSCVLIVIMLLASLSIWATLIHEYNYNGDFTDDIGGSTLQPVHTATSSFADGAWNWTANSTPGGGLLLGSALTDNGIYTLRTVFKYNVINNVWTKIISLAGLTSPATGNYYDDTGVYFSSSHIGYYNISFNSTVTHYPDTWYDLIITRKSNGDFRIYIAPLGQTPVQVISFNDSNGICKPTRPSATPGSLSYFGLFYDDTVTTAEWTAGGSVSLIQVWDDTVTLSPVQNLGISDYNSQLKLDWDLYISATSYNIYASDLPEGAWVLIGNSGTTEYIIDPTEQRKFYQIRAVLD